MRMICWHNLFVRVFSGVNKMTVGNGNMTQRHRKVLRIPSKRHPGKALPGKLHSMTRIGPGKIIKSHPGKRIIQRQTPPPCDNSNDSGLGFDHHVEMQYTTAGVRNVQNSRSKVVDDVTDDDGRKRESVPTVKMSTTTTTVNKRRKVNKIKVEVDHDTCSNDAFAFNAKHSSPSSTAGKSSTTTSIQNSSSNPTPSGNKLMAAPRHGMSRPMVRRAMGPVNLQTQIGGVSKSGQYQLQIVAQPEQQHRARYQTEGSRGAVKDRSGNGFPIVKLHGYTKPSVLQVFIGTDVDRVAPHMFYQACKVSGKNSTPCVEKKVDGTMVIELELKPEQDMTVTCDCVGILKERNVDVEHRFPDQQTPRSKKKSTRCRMVFRTILTHDDGTTETLQVCSQQIICTQPPGVPEICRKSLISCPAGGGLELFIIGKNFSKDTRVVFQTQKMSSGEVIWQEMVIPDKEYLQQTHLICTVPPYMSTELPEPVNVHLFIMASGKKSESHNFLYTPNNLSAGALAAATTRSLTQQQDVRYDEQNSKNGVCPVMIWSGATIEPKNEIDSDMMPPPTTLPLGVRRPSSTGAILPDSLSPSAVVAGLKTEIIDENSQNSMGATETNSNDYDGRSPDGGSLYGPKMHTSNIELMDESSNLSMIVNENSMDMGVYPAPHPQSLLMPAVHAANELSAKVAAVQLQQFVNAGSAADTQTQVTPAQRVQTVQKFLESNVSSGLFGTEATGAVSTVPSTTGAGIFSQITGLNSNRTTVMETNFINAGPLAIQCDAAAAAAEQILCNNSSPSSTSRSPLSQDIILNSQSVVTLAEVNGMNVLSSPSIQSATTQSDHTMSPDIIMNPTVSPSMLCTASAGAHTPMIEGQVPILNIPQTAPETMMNSMISPILASPQADHKSQPATTTAGSNTLNNMILSEILTTTQNTITTESMEALMSFNSAASMLPEQTPVSTTLNNMILTSAAQDVEQQQVQQQQVQQQQISQSGAIFSEATVAAVMAAATDMTSSTTTTAASILSGNVVENLVAPTHIINNHEIRVTPSGDLHVQRVQNDITTMNEISRRADNMIQAAATLVQNEMANSTVKVDLGIVQNNINQQPTTGTTTIPQEIATMSDHDLISYINPSCFDQGPPYGTNSARAHSYVSVTAVYSEQFTRNQFDVNTGRSNCCCGIVLALRIAERGIDIRREERQGVGEIVQKKREERVISAIISDSFFLNCENNARVNKNKGGSFEDQSRITRE
ncbi:NFAT [Sergentomyia squamirostris]